MLLQGCSVRQNFDKKLDKKLFDKKLDGPLYDPSNKLENRTNKNKFTSWHENRFPHEDVDQKRHPRFWQESLVPTVTAQHCGGLLFPQELTQENGYMCWHWPCYHSLPNLMCHLINILLQQNCLTMLQSINCTVIVEQEVASLAEGRKGQGNNFTAWAKLNIK